MNKQILAIFDFCETLVDFQTLVRFLDIVATQNPCPKPKKPNRLKRFLHRLARNFYEHTKFPFFEKYILKKLPLPRVHFKALRGLDLQVAERLAKDYATNELLNHTNQKVIDRLQWHKAQGHTIAIVSGGMEIYIKYFADFFEIPRKNIIAIELESQNGILTGNMDGIHTMEHRKLYKLVQRIDLSKFDLSKSYFYSDCPSDIPLLSFVGNPVVIECGKDILWAKILGYEVL